MAAEEKKSTQRAHAMGFNLAEYNRSVWAYTLRPGQTREDIANPDFWSHIAGRMKRFDRIEVLDEDAYYFAELIVLSANRLGITVAFLRETNLRDLEMSEIDAGAFYLKKRGPRKWCIMRTSDHVPVVEDIDTESQAKLRLAEMSVSVAA